jgi:hypothetical protein
MRPRLARVLGELHQKLKASGSIIRCELRIQQEDKCFVCSRSLEVPGRKQIDYKVFPWELAKSELLIDDVCWRANHDNNLVVIHSRCRHGLAEMRKRLSAEEKIIALGPMPVPAVPGKISSKRKRGMRLQPSRGVRW